MSIKSKNHLQKFLQSVVIPIMDEFSEMISSVNDNEVPLHVFVMSLETSMRSL